MRENSCACGNIKELARKIIRNKRKNLFGYHIVINTAPEQAYVELAPPLILREYIVIYIP